MGRLVNLSLRGAYWFARGDPERLPWHRLAPHPHLITAIEKLGHRGRALDVGCGSGMFCAYLARQGLDVIGVDLLPSAVQMARKVAEEERLAFQVVEQDVLEYQSSEQFDLVHDSGCLHC